MSAYDGPSADQFRSAIQLIEGKQRDIEISLKQVVFALSVLSDQLDCIIKKQSSRTGEVNSDAISKTVGQQLVQLQEQERAKTRWPSEYHGSTSSFREIY